MLWVNYRDVDVNEKKKESLRGSTCYLISIDLSTFLIMIYSEVEFAMLLGNF